MSLTFENSQPESIIVTSFSFLFKYRFLERYKFFIWMASLSNSIFNLLKLLFKYLWGVLKEIRFLPEVIRHIKQFYSTNDYPTREIICGYQISVKCRILSKKICYV